MSTQRIPNIWISGLLIIQLLSPPEVWAAGASERLKLSPLNIVPKGAAEYFSTDPGAQLLMPINIWGEVTQPGIHYIPVGSSVIEAVSSAGGPTGLAVVSNVSLIRDNKNNSVDLLDVESSTIKVKENDTIYIKRSIKTDLPIVFSGLSVLVSLATLCFVIIRQK